MLREESHVADETIRQRIRKQLASSMDHLQEYIKEGKYHKLWVEETTFQ